ncbi:RHS repeat-associated core domain-containing protein [Flavobacterium psychrophilum]|uniref:RHS repeat-associated core domain-containing protein n=1 Tax=Flavobacterium psychrophilum TaxID=96345 RepID=UPI0021D457D5|nr:M91 family zinc metallopeptidase [Flavobacterium psychrophilum]
MAFGEVLFEEHSSSFKSPYLFNGKELDRETNLTNFGARYLDMKTSLWLNVDPLAEKYPGVSSYVFCLNNPLIYVDPDGKEIILTGTVAERNTILSSLRKLTNDKLVINSSGVVSISRIGGENTGKRLSSGSSLIRELNKKGTNEKSVTISIGTPGSGNSESDINSTNAINGVGSNTTVNFDITSSPTILTENSVTGNVSGQSRPNEIGLGHELVHAVRSMKGEAVDYSTTDTHTYKDATGTSTTQTKPLEELQTSGLKPSRVPFNENKLRIEQGLDKRGAY